MNKPRRTVCFSGWKSMLVGDDPSFNILKTFFGKSSEMLTELWSGREASDISCTHEIDDLRKEIIIDIYQCFNKKKWKIKLASLEGLFRFTILFLGIPLSFTVVLSSKTSIIAATNME